MFIPKVKTLDSVKCLTLLEAKRILWACTGVFKALEGVKVASIVWNESPRVSTLTIQWWHLYPFLVQNIKFLAVCHHFFMIIAASDNIDEAISEVVVSCERCPSESNIGHLFDCLSVQMEHERVIDWTLSSIHIVTWDYKQFVVRDVNGASEFQLFVQTFAHHIILIFRLEELPLLAIFRVQFA